MAATRPDLRVGDAERDSTATALREHYAQGRLSTDELNERLDAAFSATTHGQLEQVTDDLPHIQPAPAAPPPEVAVPGRRPGRLAARAVTALVTVVALLAVVAIANRGGVHVPRNIATLVIALLILRALVGRAFGHQHQHHHHQHWDHRADAFSSEDDGDDDRFDRFDQSDRFDRSGRRRHEHHHEHHSRSGHGYRYSYRYEYKYEHPRDSR
jgi:Domain of unknown function (DUF1707)